MSIIKQDNQNSTTKATVRPYGSIVLTLENCLLPETKLSPTPSQNDGLDKETETDLRILGCQLIQTAGILLKLPQVAMATGQVLFQRFYYSKSFVRHAMETTAMGCVCLASKIEEAPRRIRDVINIFHHIKQVLGQKTIQTMVLDQNYISLKNQVIKAERRVLKELGFCVHVKHPHKLIVMYLNILKLDTNQNLMQMSWNYMTDALRTDVFMRFQPETVACACIYLTARKLNLPLPKSPSWYGLFKVSEADIHTVCFKILALYTRPKPNAEELDRRIDILKRRYEEARQKARGGAGGGNNTPGAGSNSPPSHPPSPGRTKPLKTSPYKGGFICRNHTAEKRSHSRSGSGSRSPPAAKHKRNKKHRLRSVSLSKSRSRSRSPLRNSRKLKKHHKPRHSYSRSPSISPPTKHKITRSPSRTPVHNERKSRKHKSRRSHSRSMSISPSVRNSASKITREKPRYRSRSRSYEGRRARSSSFDKYEPSKEKSRTKHERIKDRR